MLTGENSILSRATQASATNQIGTAQDAVSLYVADKVAEFYEEAYVKGETGTLTGGLNAYLKTAVKKAEVEKEIGNDKITLKINSDNFTAQNGGVVFKLYIEDNTADYKSEGTVVNGKVSWKLSKGEKDEYKTEREAADEEQDDPVVPSGTTSKLTDADRTAISAHNTADQTNNGGNDQIAELTATEIAALPNGEDLTGNARIKAVLTGGVPLTTEMTYVEGTKDTGVVVSINGNEFVWVPVPDVISTDTSSISTSGVDLNANEATSRPMAKPNGTNNYEGLLYTFSGTTSTYKPEYTVSDTSTYREPAYLANYSESSSNPGDIMTEYKNMVESVDKYKGFYVARYELGLEGTTPVSKPASNTVKTANASNTNTSSWYGLYNKCNSMYRDNSATSTQNVTSQMIWGSQYDAMMNWMAKTGKTVGTKDDNKYNKAQTTGSKEDDKINNVYDLYGCHFEWTQEANDTDFRVIRGGHSYNSVSPSDRDYDYPGYAYATGSSRSSLYIKL